MFETVVTLLFLALLVGIVWLAFRISGSMVKWGVLVALALVLPVLVKSFLVASGIFLLMPLGLLLMAFGLVKACV
jgi:hypothetical protein